MNHKIPVGITITILIMLTLGCPQNLRENNQNEFEQAVVAIESGAIESLKTLLQQHPHLANARNPDTKAKAPGGHSLLHILSTPPGHKQHRKQIAQLLISRGCDVNGRTNYTRGDTALHMAAQSNDIVLLETLLENGANIDATGSHVDSGSALQVAIHYGSQQAAQLLENSGASVNAAPLAAGLGDLKLFRNLIHSSMAIPSRHKIISMYLRSFNYAVFNHKFEVADQLLLSGVDINGRHEMDNYTLLHLVASRGSTAMAKYLLKHGAKTNIRSGKDYMTPLQTAIKYNNTRVANLLSSNN